MQSQSELQGRPGRLQDRVAIITGGSNGIGQAIAVAYAKEGALVVVADLEPTGQTFASTVDRIVSEGGRALFRQTDVCDAASSNALVARAVETYGRLDIIVNAAGVAPEIKNPQPIWAMPDSNWTTTMGVNATGVMNCCRAATAQMMRQDPLPNGDRGWVVNLSSIYGQTAVPGNGIIFDKHCSTVSDPLTGINVVAYCASKHAVLGLTKAAALDCAPHLIRVNAICPGFTATPMTSSLLASTPEYRQQIEAVQPLKGVGTATDVARIAVMLASEDVGWVTGIAMPVDGGFLCQ